MLCEVTMPVPCPPPLTTSCSVTSSPVVLQSWAHGPVTAFVSELHFTWGPLACLQHYWVKMYPSPLVKHQHPVEIPLFLEGTVNNPVWLETPWKDRRTLWKPESVSRFSRGWVCGPTDSSPPGSSVHSILWARTLEWAAVSFSRGS